MFFSFSSSELTSVIMNISWRHLSPVALLLVLACMQSCRDEGGNTWISAGSQQEHQENRAKIQWLEFNEGLARAQADDKPIMINFYTDWCVYCKKLDRETLQKQNVARMLTENFISVRLNAERMDKHIRYRNKTFSYAEFSRHFGVTAYPSLAFLDASGQPIALIPGYVPAPQFMAILQYINQECYQTQVSLHEFARRGNCN